MIVVEHKTTSKDITPGSLYWRRLAFDPQVSLYLNSDNKISSVLYDVIRKPQLRLKVNESHLSFRDRIVEDIAKDPAKYFQRATLVRLEDEQTQAMRDAWQTAKLISHSKRLQLYPRNASSCSSFNRVCEYWGVCSGETQLTDGFLFEDKPTTLGADVLSVSALKSYASCARKYFYAYVERRIPKSKSHALTFGKMFHRLLEEWWKTKGDLDSSLRLLTPEACDATDAAKAWALLLGYHAKWSPLTHDVISTEATFTGPLIDPDTGEHSKDWKLGGVVDAVTQEI